MAKKVYILGGYQTDFAQNWSRNELDLFDVFKDTVHQGLSSTNLEPKDIDVAHVAILQLSYFVIRGIWVVSLSHLIQCFIQEFLHQDMRLLVLQEA